MHSKLLLLEEIIRGYGSVLLAFSGGVDSSFLLQVCSKTLDKKDFSAVIANSSLMPRRELIEAVELAARIGVSHEIVDFDELSIEEVALNTPDRCYFCKKALFGSFANKAREKGLKHVIDGSNVDDAGDFRPGLTAIRELAVKSPLMEAGLSKDDIRRLSRQMGLKTWDKPSLACLASRIPYGESIDREKLKRVELAEDALLALGFTQFRVRSHDDLARIELVPDEMNRILQDKIRDEVVARLKKAGFKYIGMDLMGFRSGSMNEVLDEREMEIWKS